MGLSLDWTFHKDWRLNECYMGHYGLMSIIQYIMFYMRTRSVISTQFITGSCWALQVLLDFIPVSKLAANPAMCDGVTLHDYFHSTSHPSGEACGFSCVSGPTLSHPECSWAAAVLAKRDQMVFTACQHQSPSWTGSVWLPRRTKAGKMRVGGMVEREG